MIDTAYLPRERRALGIAFIVLAVCLGIFLRGYQMSTQILMDDEWHAIRKLLASDYADIVTHFGFADYCIPMTLYFKYLTLHGGLTEWGMRWPMLLCGMALVGVAPWLVRRQAGLATLAMWSGLLAISPMMSYHTRVTRPYSITTLLVFVALIAFYRWWTAENYRTRWAVVYVVCTFFAGWLHLIALPFALMPFVFFGVASVWTFVVRRSDFDARKFGWLMLIGIVTSVALTAALVPPFMGDWISLQGKSGTGLLTVESVYHTILVCFGIASPFLLCVIALLCIAGVVSWWRRERLFVAYILATCLVGAMAIAATRPAWSQNAVTYGRYLQPAVPFLLMFVAEGFAWLVASLAMPARLSLAGVATAVLFIAGPMPEYLYNPDQFMADPYFQLDYDAANNPLRTGYPTTAPPHDFYRRLAAQPPRSLTLVEAPWSIYSYYNGNKFYQPEHRQLIRAGFIAPVCGVPGYGEYGEDAGIRLRHYVHLTALTRGEQNGDFFVLHRKAWPKPHEDWPDVDACLPTIEAKLGAPIVDDGDIVVFALSDKARALAPALR